MCWRGCSGVRLRAGPTSLILNLLPTAIGDYSATCPEAARKRHAADAMASVRLTSSTGWGLLDPFVGSSSADQPGPRHKQFVTGSS